MAGTALGLTIPVNAYERLGELQVPLLVMIGDRDQDFVRNSIDFLDQLIVARAISFVRFETDAFAVTDRHALDRLVEAGDDLAAANLELERIAAR